MTTRTNLVLRPEDESRLQSMVTAPSTPQGVVQRARIALAAAAGESDAAIAQRLGLHRHTVRLWRERVATEGLEGLETAAGRGRKPSIPAATVGQLLTKAVKPPRSRTRWSCRSMAEVSGVSKSTVQRVWSANDLKPHRIDTFKISNDPQFEVKFWDVIGLYLNPPDKSLVLCCDEKPQCQALERTQPGLPLGVGHIKTQTHDYHRHGTVTLFAALDYLEGKVFGRIEKRHTQVEWLNFLKQLDKETPAELDLHLILDNYGTHRTAEVLEWVKQHPRIHLHFTPASASWMNLVERFFSELTVNVVRDGSFGSVKALVKAIQTALEERNLHPKRFVWKAEGEAILRKINRAKAAAGTV